MRYRLVIPGLFLYTHMVKRHEQKKGISMSKNKPPIPRKMELLSLETPHSTRQQWLTVIQDRIRAFKKALREKGSDQRLGMTDAMVKRRTEALLDSIPHIQKRYKDLPGFDSSVSNDLGNAWLHLNYLASSTYNQLARDAYITQAAALWILDQIAELSGRIIDIHTFLPRDKDELDALEWPPIWSPAYDYDLIQSVTYVIEKRNQDIAPVEIDPARCRRVTTSELTAKRKHYEDVDSRKNFEGLLSLIPQGKIDMAIVHFETAFWQWTDRYFRCLSVMDSKKMPVIAKINAAAEEYNLYREELISAFRKGNKPSAVSKPKQSPLVMKPLSPAQAIPSPEDFIKSFSPMNGLSGMERSDLPFMAYPKDKKDPSADQMMAAADKMSAAADRYAAAQAELDELTDQLSMYTYSMSLDGYMDKEYCARECGEDVAALMEELRIDDPFELCFALLYLIDDPKREFRTSTVERIDPYDLPWLYGAGTSFMRTVVNELPWAFREYEEFDDPVWHPDLEDDDEEKTLALEKVETKKTVLPDYYERKYVSNEDEKRSLAQIIYEETSCVLPRYMKKYDGEIRYLREYGARAKDMPFLLSVMNLSGSAMRQHKALNLDKDSLSWLPHGFGQENDADAEPDGQDATDEEEKELSREELQEQVKALQAQVKEYQAQNKQLRSSVHALEQDARKTEKALEQEKAAAEMEHRELADLRELIFNQENGEEETVDESDDSFPYEVKADTLIFGGHSTWLKAIRQMLKGNIRFIDKDLHFDVNIVRNAERIWIQPNALSHTQYYRVIDTARLFHKPVRYFAYASALKCARQLAEGEKT